MVVSKNTNRGFRFPKTFVLNKSAVLKVEVLFNRSVNRLHVFWVQQSKLLK